MKCPTSLVVVGGGDDLVSTVCNNMHIFTYHTHNTMGMLSLLYVSVFVFPTVLPYTVP